MARLTDLPLRGVIPPLVTPLADDDVLDEGGLEQLVEHVVTGGVHGLFVLGTTGEGPCLSHALRQKMIARTIECASGRVPVLAGITDTSFAEMLDLAHFAADAGAAAVVASTPYYLGVSQDELRAYVDELAQRSPLPVLLYNTPAMTKVGFGLDVLRHGMDLKNVVGMKDSSGDLGFFGRVQALAAHRPDWTLLVGPEEILLPARVIGAHGGVSGGANMFPRLYVALHRALTEGDMPRALELHRCLMVVGEGIYRVNNEPAAVIKGMKCALGALGLCGERLSKPLRPVSEAERVQIRRNVKEIQELLGGLALSPVAAGPA